METTINLICIQEYDYFYHEITFITDKEWLPKNGRNLGDYDDYKLMCSRSVSFYLIKITQLEYEEISKYVPFNVSPIDGEEYPNEIFDNFLITIGKIKNDYYNNIHNNQYNCCDYDDVNDKDYFLMYIEHQC
jgi:hypothetical protein